MRKGARKELLLLLKKCVMCDIINSLINKNLEVIMRKCVRCNIAMIENCGIKVKGAAYGLVLTDDENKWWGGRMEQPKVAICPKCGEVSIYLENVDKLKNK